MLNAAILSTEEFIGWMSDGRAPAVRDSLSPSTLQKQLGGKFCAVVMPTGPIDDGRSPVIVVSKRKVEDFFAFVSTYVTQYTPFTAFFRVVTTEDLGLLTSEFDLAPSIRRDGIFERFVGVAITEAALYTRARGTNEDGKSISLTAANATYSAAAIQGLRQGAMADVMAIGKGWHSLRSYVGGDRLPLDLERAMGLWSLVRLALYGGPAGDLPSADMEIVVAIRHLIDLGRITDEFLEELLSLVPEITPRISSFRGPREQRAKAVQEALTILANLRSGQGHARDCVAGFLLSSLGDGSFKFLPTALTLSSSLPMAPLWFALWSGLQPSSDLMTAFNCLGRRLARDLRSRNDIFSEPVDDVSLIELQTIGDSLESILRGQGSSLSVEIYPNVSSRQGLSRATFSSAARDFQKEFKELRYLLAQSSAILSKIDGSYSDQTDTKNEKTEDKPSTRRRFR